MDLKKLPKENTYDAIVIGSGLGGMCCAALLAKVNKKKVLIVEQHSEFGGCTHEFKRGAYSWDVGLHYVGDLEKTVNDSLTKKLFDYITDGHLKWNKMPDVFERFILPDMTIEIPAGIKNYENALIAKFPDDAKDIKRYIKDILTVQKWYLKYFFSNFFTQPIASVFKFMTKFNLNKAMMTVAEYMNKYISNPKLRNILSMRWGNYGLDPEKAAFATHALVEEHYYDGGCFPDGGAGTIGGYIENVIEKNGGCSLTNAKVTRILLDGKTAYGVEVKDMAADGDKLTQFYAPIIVSDAGALNTYLRMLPDLNLDIQKQLSGYKTQLSAVNVYFGLKASPKTIGINGENIWINQTASISDFDKSCDWINDKSKLPLYGFLSFPSLKSVSNDEKIAHTADAILIVPYKFFEKWQNEHSHCHGSDYYRLKDQIVDTVFDLIDKHVPGLRDLITYTEVATPLTFNNYLNSYKGTIYGLPEYVQRYKMKDLKVHTPIKNLYLTGTDILSNGIVPAIMSGMGTAVHLNGFWGIIKVMSKVTTFKPENVREDKKSNSEITVPTHSNKKVATLVSCVSINDNLLEVTFVFNENVNLTAGQHVKLNVGLGMWRAYSVAKCEDNKIVLIIDKRPNGVGVNFIRNLLPGQKAVFRLPISDLVLRDNNNDKVLIGSGTGAVPFIAMVDSLAKQKFAGKVIFLFGCLTEADNFIERYLEGYKDKLNLETHIYIENLQNDDNKNSDIDIQKGRVTQFFTSESCRYANSDFYLCGHPNMVNASIEKIRQFGGENIYY